MSFAILALCLTGCAGITHKPVPYTPVSEINPKPGLEANSKADEKTDGVRYYQASPYLLVYSDGKGGIGWKIYYLPDQTLKMTAKPYNFVSKVNGDMTFSNGMLTDSSADIDSAALPKGIISALEKLAPALMAAADLPKEKGHQIPAPRLYKITVKDNQVILAGREGTQTVKVTGPSEK